MGVSVPNPASTALTGRDAENRSDPPYRQLEGAAGMEVWLIWLVVAVALGIAEIFTLTAALGVVAGASLITAVLAATGLPLGVQFVVFAAAATAGVVLVRPVALRHMRLPQSHLFGVEALVGTRAYVVQEVTDRDGRVRIGGEEWTARPFDDSLVIPVGAAVDVMRINGSTAIVYPRE
jgi:membrane protein implicated in regulation of membrane protease activity